MKLRLIVIHLLMVLLQACGTNAQASKEDEKTPSDIRKSQAEILYGCVVDEFSTQELPLYFQDDKKMLLISEYATVNPQIRRRHIARVISVQQGLAFNVTVEYERKDMTGETPVWVRAEDKLTLQRAHREEQKWGESVRVCFKSKS